MKIKISNYIQNPCAMAITVFDEKLGVDTIITKNLGDYANPDNDILLMPFTSFVDVNNVPKYLIKELEEKGIMSPMTRWGAPATLRSGFVEYPQYEFNEDYLLKIVPEEVKEYRRKWMQRYEELYPCDDEPEEETA